ncbi:MAG: tRNA pseudouridine(38-40) synthase TruA [Deltaproteobacteria bacterium]|nr:tRNA pseudouridine(38-40) synthase TruA [Deltaproteobacteria bacterium]
MRTIKLLIEYDGTNYLGWQVQAKGLTIQGMIEEKLKLLTGEGVCLIGSGRTDAGAHAFGQVAHFKVQNRMDAGTIQKAINSLLPPDIVIKKAEEVEENFHARKQARSKIYEYRILNRPIRSVFHRGYAWHIPQKSDWEEVKKATQKLVGEHDFSSFRSTGTPTKTAVRKIFRAEWKKGRDGLMRFEIEASGFLKQMVRAIVGTLVEVGRGKIDADEFQKILESKDRKKAGPTAPAHGLFLKEVKYDGFVKSRHSRGNGNPGEF